MNRLGGVLGLSWRRPGAVLGTSWSVLGRPGALCGRLGSVLEVSCIRFSGQSGLKLRYAILDVIFQLIAGYHCLQKIDQRIPIPIPIPIPEQNNSSILYRYCTDIASVLYRYCINTVPIGTRFGPSLGPESGPECSGRDC